MRTSVDSQLYISGADDLIKGRFPIGRELFYTSYMLILAGLSITNLPPESVIYIHFAAAIIAIICIYKIVKTITGNNLTALFASFIYVIWFKFQQWNLIVYTDALFSHMVIISIFILRNTKTKAEIIKAVIIVLFTSFLRPTGLGLLFSTSIYLSIIVFEKLSLNQRKKRITLIVGISIFLALLNTILGNFIDSFISSYEIAEIIYPKINLFVQPPISLFVPDINHPPLLRLVLFIFNNPIYFFKISAIKGLLFIAHVKPYYSLYHNIIIIGFLYPIYILAIRGFLYLKNDIYKVVMSSFIVFQVFTVSLTSENWDGRFLLPTLPLIFIFSSIGVDSIFRKKSVTNDKLNEQTAQSANVSEEN